MACEQCDSRIPAPRRSDARFCSGACRQRAYRARRDVVPARMRGGRRWVRAAGKRPVQPGGAPASSTSPATWSAFADVQSGAGDGFGVMLGGGLACWDLDDCFVGGRLAGWARDALVGVVPIYAERSVSGRGLHVFVEAPEGPGMRRGGVEFYSRARFIRVTGDRVVLEGVL